MAMDLNARVDEDEAAAKACTDAPWKCEVFHRGTGRAEWVVVGRTGSQAVIAGDLGVGWMAGLPHDGEHIARHDPARERREVTFKRALLALHQPQPFYGNNPPPARDQTPENAVAWYCECQCPDGVIEGEYPCETVRLLAAVYGP